MCTCTPHTFKVHTLELQRFSICIYICITYIYAYIYIDMYTYMYIYVYS